MWPMYLAGRATLAGGAPPDDYHQCGKRSGGSSSRSDASDRLEVTNKYTGKSKRTKPLDSCSEEVANFYLYTGPPSGRVEPT